MHYISVFTPRERMKASDFDSEWREWVGKCRDEVLDHGCREIRRFETSGDTPHVVFLMMDLDDPSAIDMINEHFGTSWVSKVYPVHLAHDMPEDHSVIGG